jgi:hypothetical protein
MVDIAGSIDVRIAGPMFRHQAPQEICLVNTANQTNVLGGQETVEKDCGFAKAEAIV